jgi:putative membrane protein
MNNVIRWGFALGLLPLAACAGNPPPPPAPPAPPPLAATDATFITAATQGGLTEVAEAQTALKQTHNPAIVSYANQMVSFHTQANQNLAAIAVKKGVTPPASPSDAQTQEATALQSETGRKFNHDYIADQIAGHQAAVSAFQDEATNGTDPDLKAFAQSSLPTVQQHLAMAQSLEAKMSGHGGRHHRHHAAG